MRILSKGARGRRSPLKGALQPFTPLLIRWSGRGEIKTLRDAEPISLALPLTGTVLYSGLYLNELLSRVLEMAHHIARFFRILILFANPCCQ